MRIALYQPDIPQNTGTILRMAACLAVPVSIIGPAGFDLSDRALRRAGLDYVASARLERHAGWEAFLAWVGSNSTGSRLVLMTTSGSVRHIDFAFSETDILLFGRESAGVPDHVQATADERLRIPMVPGLRSLNLAISAGIVVAEALRQTNGWPT